MIKTKKAPTEVSASFGSPNRTSNPVTRAYRFSGIGRHEEMLQLAELRHAKVLILPRVALSQSVRVANNDC